MTHLLECNEYETDRENMRKRIFNTCGIKHFDLHLLGSKKDDDYKERRGFLLSELKNFVVETKCFTTQT